MTKVGHKVTKVLSVDPDTFKVGMQFSDGFSGKLSLKKIFEKPKGLAAEILRGGFFNQCFIEAGALAWPNGFELCPDSLRDWLMAQQHQGKKAA